MELPRLTVLNERFAIRSVLGELGPFEATYLAWDLENEEQVVVREYLPMALAKRDARGIGLAPKAPEVEKLYRYGLEHITKEARLFSNVDHPNVVREREFFLENGTIYRILDYHAGASLAYVLKQQGGKVPPKTAVTILMPLLDGIRAGHQQGLVHGAISPDKIYLTKSGRPMLLAFKTTHLLLAQRTQNLISFQQPGFSPPEQYTPRGKHGPWSDVYGCGATLYTMLSGRRLPDIPARLREDIVPSLIDQAFELSAGTREALKTALDMNITRRPQTIDVFRGMLVQGFNLPGAHVPPPAEEPARDSFRPPVNRAPEPVQEQAPEDMYADEEHIEEDYLEEAYLEEEYVGEEGYVEEEYQDEEPVREHEEEEPLHDYPPVRAPRSRNELRFETEQMESAVQPPAARNKESSGPMHFGPPKPLGAPTPPVGQPSINAMYSKGGVEQEMYDDELAGQPFGDSGGLNGHFAPPVPGNASVALSASNGGQVKPAVYERHQPVVEEKAWKFDPGYNSSREVKTRSGGRRIILVCFSIGAFLILAFLAYNRLQQLEPAEAKNSGYSVAVVKGDSLFTLAQDVLKTDNPEKARELFVRALDQYTVALAYSNGEDTNTLKQRITSANSYLSTPVEQNFDEKELLAFISRGDSILRAADQLNLTGDSVEARSLYQMARNDYLKVLDVRPDDSLASARYRQANQRLVAPVRVANPASEQRVATVSQAERQQQLYLTFKTRGDSAFNVRNFKLAKENFTQALTHMPGDSYVTARLGEIADAEADAERRGQYRQHMNAGNRYKSSGRLEDARNEFVFALRYMPADEAAESAIFEVDSILEQQQRREEEYVSHKTRGEVLLEREEYENALASFRSALIAKPDDEYASRKIQEIRDTISSLARQEKELPEGMVDDNGIYNYTEEAPELVGGREVLQSRLRYPPKALEAGLEGRVSVRMIVDETGRMLNPTIVKGIRYDLDEEVMRVIRGARFEPGRVGGQPVKSWYTLFFEFKIDNE